MIRRTTWRPDTCGCVIEFEWDDSQPEDSRQTTPVRGISVCSLHQDLNTQEQYNALIEDNSRKNKVEQMLAELLPELTDTVQDVDKNPVKVLKKPLEHKYLPGRILEIKLPSEIQGKKVIENELHARLKESMKVVVV